MKQQSLAKFRFDPFFGSPPKIVFLAFLLTLSFYAIESFYLSNGSSESITSFFSGDIVLSVVFAAYFSLAFYSFWLFIIISLNGSVAVRFVCILAFTLSTLIQYGYQKGLGRFADHNDLHYAMSATSDQRSYAVTSFADWFAVIPIAVLIITSVLVADRLKPIRNRVSVVVLLIVCIFYLHFALIKPVLFGSVFYNNSFGAFLTTTANLFLTDPIEQISPPKRAPVEPVRTADGSKPLKNIVVIFDESIRADHLSLNGYKRPTTPYLEELQRSGTLLNWGTASSASTSSHTSFDAFISGATPDMITELGVRKINTLPSLFQYAKAMNYRTHYIDGQMMKYWGGLSDDTEFIDVITTMAEIDSPNRKEDWQISNKVTNLDNQVNAVKQWEIDEKIANIVRKTVTDSTGNFIFVYKRGSHFPYEKNYPEDAGTWKPIYRFTENFEIPPSEEIDAVINSYDNSVKYNLDRFFLTLLKKSSLSVNNTVVFYTADHGQSFYANGRAGHGGKTKEEATVPFFAIGLDITKIKTSVPVAHANIFTSLLDLIGYPEANRVVPYATSIFDPNHSTVPRSYNTPQGEKLPFDQ